RGSCFDDLALFDRDFGDAASDLRANLDLAGFDGAGVLKTIAMCNPGRDGPDCSDDNHRNDSADDDAPSHAHLSNILPVALSIRCQLRRWAPPRMRPNILLRAWTQKSYTRPPPD